jgi:hypothetical protein
MTFHFSFSFFFFFQIWKVFSSHLLQFPYTFEFLKNRALLCFHKKIGWKQPSMDVHKLSSPHQFGSKQETMDAWKHNPPSEEKLSMVLMKGDGIMGPWDQGHHAMEVARGGRLLKYKTLQQLPAECLAVGLRLNVCHGSPLTTSSTAKPHGTFVHSRADPCGTSSIQCPLSLAVSFDLQFTKCLASTH